MPGFAALVVIGLQILHVAIPFFCSMVGVDLIPAKGKHLDKLEAIDHLCIAINKCLIVVFAYHAIWLCYVTPTVSWKLEEITFLNTIGSLLAFFIFYDFFYTIFHRILHLRSLYPYIHKHHHRQKAPSRGNTDGINVHPFEFVVGEYLHLVAIYFIPCHIAAVVVFILLGGILASLNHTRFDIVVPGVYSVKVHDVHHRLPESNYGQYIMLWDYLMGSYRPYGTPIPRDHNE